MKINPIDKMAQSKRRDKTPEERAQDCKRIADTYPDDHPQKAAIYKQINTILGKKIDIIA